MKSYILLENVEFHANHGVFEQENIVGNTFIVNLKIKIDLEKASLTDNLDDTLSYASVFDILKEEMAITSRLLEHVAGRIIRRLKNYSPLIKKVELKIAKRNPPMSGQVEYASVILID